jgi:hypothetical protein
LIYDIQAGDKYELSNKINMKYRISLPENWYAVIGNQFMIKIKIFIDREFQREKSLSTILFDEKVFLQQAVASENLFEKRINHRVELEILHNLEALH